MGESSKIEWTDHTFNPWIGCAKVSAGCKHCYAEVLMDKRFGRVVWGEQGTRELTSLANRRKPIKWNMQSWMMCNDCSWRGPVEDIAVERGDFFCPECMQSGVVSTRQRVFCGSLMDVFEDRPDLNGWRAYLFSLMENTTNLDWQILTKRPENIEGFVPRHWHNEEDGAVEIPPNIWIGVSVENQETADRRIALLTHINAKVRFLSVEPLLGPIDLFDSELWPRAISVYRGDRALPLGARQGFDPDTAAPVHYLPHVDWVIVGGESGRNARPMDPNWARDVHDQCVAAGVPFFMKQMDKKQEIPPDLFIRESPHV